MQGFGKNAFFLGKKLPKKPVLGLNRGFFKNNKFLSNLCVRCIYLGSQNVFFSRDLIYHDRPNRF